MSNTTETVTASTETVAVKRPVGRPRIYTTDQERKDAAKAAAQRFQEKKAAERADVAAKLTFIKTSRLSVQDRAAIQSVIDYLVPAAE